MELRLLGSGGYAPEGIAARALVERLLGSPFAPPRFVEYFREVHELTVGQETAIGAFRVRTRIQPLHSNRTLALRIDDALILCLESFAGAGTANHTAARRAAEVAAAAGASKLVLIHLDPLVEDETALPAAARAVFPEVVLGEDGPVVPLP